MNRNHLKVIACFCMFCDHAGLLLFPQAAFLRWIGRLAMPLFAFFIGEGCLHTSNRKKYLRSLLLLGVFCQAVFAAEELFVTRRLSVSSGIWYFNILFTFSLAAALCFLFTDAKKSVLAVDRGPAARRIAAFVLGFCAVAGLTAAAWLLRRRGWSLYFDYGLCGVLLPLSVTVFEDRRRKLALFAAALLVYCVVYRLEMPYVWFSLFTVPLLCLYNGEGGSKKLKYMFYVFYPAHLGLLYLISLFV